MWREDRENKALNTFQDTTYENKKYTYTRFFLLNPLPHKPILGSYNSAVNKDMMSKIWKNGVQLPYWVENILGKGEIARYKQFLLFPQCFQKLSVVDVSKRVFME